MDNILYELRNLGQFIFGVFDDAQYWVRYLVQAISGNPLLLLACVGVPLCGIGVAMLKRLFSDSV